MKAIALELSACIGLQRACQALGLARSSFYRQPQSGTKTAVSPKALALEEKLAVRDLLNSERFVDKAPRQVYAQLLDEGQYLCHWRSMYRILAEHGEVVERRRQAQRPLYTKPELLAQSPNQVWSWDITKLKTEQKWTSYALYTVLDIYSRYVVGWMLADREDAELAKELIKVTCHKQGIVPEQLTLHADNGSPMKAKTFSQLLVDLGILESHSRPYTSDDNPFSEAQFRTMKYHATYPTTFGSEETARTWLQDFFTWYNHEHYHSGLNLLTPASVHYGAAPAIQNQRQAVMNAAFARHPERFSLGMPQVKGAPDAVYINPPKHTENLV
jgi:putative transposase